MTTELNPLRAHICPHDQLAEVCKRVKPTHVILICDVGDIPTQILRGTKGLVLHFNDYVGQEPTAPQPEHVDAILDFILDLKQPASLVASCTFGQSRSAAVALAISSLFALSAPHLIDAFADLQGEIAPNSRLTDLFVARFKELRTNYGIYKVTSKFFWLNAVGKTISDNEYLTKAGHN